MPWVLWTAFAFCVYTLMGYAACLAVLGLFLRRKRQRHAIEPSVSILIAVRGAENIIEEKLRNCLALDYPKGQLEIFVACDGPSPATEAIARSFQDSRIRVISVPALGKSFALGAALEVSSGAIVVFTDAAVRLDPNGVREIVSNFADPKVGCVSSEDVTPSCGNAESIYISFDMRLRQLESRIRSLVNASGSFFAVRREICRGWHAEMSSDFFLPLHAIEDGFDVVVDPRALGYVSAPKTEREFERKVRTIVHGLDVLFEHWRVLNPFVYGVVAWELASHKLFRWILPLGFPALFLSNVLLWNSGWLYRIALVCQAAFYGVGILGWTLNPLRRFLPFRVAGFFLMGNVATAQAWWMFLRGERYASWKPSQRDVVTE